MLHLRAALCEQDLKIIRDAEHASQFVLNLSLELNKLFTLVTQLHDRDSCATPVHHLTLGLVKDLLENVASVG